MVPSWPQSETGGGGLGWTRGLEPPTLGITIRCSNQLSYAHHPSGLKLSGSPRSVNAGFKTAPKPVLGLSQKAGETSPSDGLLSIGLPDPDDASRLQMDAPVAQLDRAAAF